jgi:hypothetical protein
VGSMSWNMYVGRFAVPLKHSDIGYRSSAGGFP